LKACSRLKPARRLHLTERDGASSFRAPHKPERNLEGSAAPIRDLQPRAPRILSNSRAHGSGVIDRSLFEAVAARGRRTIRRRSRSRRYSAGYRLLRRHQPGDSCPAVTYEELYEHGKSSKTALAGGHVQENNGRVYRAARYVGPTGAAQLLHTRKAAACGGRFCARRLSSRA